MHRADAIDGTAKTEYNVNLYYKNFDYEIIKNGASAARWNNPNPPVVKDNADVNGDSQVDISDVNSVISVICGTEKSDIDAYVNQDGAVDISDVNAVINVICGK